MLDHTESHYFLSIVGEFFALSKYLVTGGCGFIGSHLADALIASGCGVRILDDLSTGKRQNAPDEAELIVGSITDQALLEGCVEGVDGVFHLAAVASVQKSLDQWAEVHHVNSGGTVRLFEALSRLKHKIPLVYASSSCVYGEAAETPISEKSIPHPLSPYGIEKLEGEWEAQILWNIFKVPSTTFRFFNVFGPRQDPSSPYSGVISVFFDRLSNGKKLTIFGNGDQMRDFIYVKDVVRMLLEAMQRPMQGASVFNLCTGVGTSINQLATLMAPESEKEHVPAREGEVRVSIGDPSKIQQALQLKSSYTLEEGLKDMMICV